MAARPLLALDFPVGPALVTVAPDLCEMTSDVTAWLTLWDGRRVLLGIVRAGFRTDGVSRPGLLAWWLKRWGAGLGPAVIHDWFLAQLAAGKIGRPKYLIDLLFLALLVADGVSFLRATVMFLAVRTRAAPRAA